MGRPRRLLRWAWGSGASLVEPSSGKAAVGYVDGELVPAGWFNTHLHLTGAWLGYLRGPHPGNWSRAAHAALTAFDAVSDVTGLAADTVTLDKAVAVYRYAIVGQVSATPALRVSRRGLGAGWVARALPSMTGEVRGIAFVGRWLVWSETTGELWSTIADDRSGNSAIGTNDATKWASVGAAATVDIRAAAWCAGVTGRAAGARHAVVFAEGSWSALTVLHSTDSGATWGALSVPWSSVLYSTGGDYDATRDRFVGVNSVLDTALSPVGAPGGTWAVSSGPGGLPGGDAFRIRCGGGTWIAWAVAGVGGGAPSTGDTIAYRTANAGATWTHITTSLPTVPGGSDPVAPTDLRYADGVWYLTVADAPYLYASHDNGDSWERVALPVGEESTWALARVIYADGQVLATGVDFCVASGRAMATEDTTLVPDTTPSILSDAYRLRGRTISTTAPTSGQVYTWNSGTSQWEPTALTAAPSGAAGGDLGGTYPNPTVTSGANHTHTASQIASGTLAVARGGTGGGTAAAARDALGVQDGPRLIPLFAYATADNAVATVQALAGFTPADYAITARTTVLTLDAIGSVTSGSQTGTLEVLNAAGTVVASIDWTETTPTRKTDTITLPGSAEIYRARVSCAGVVDPLTDYALIGGANLRITWS